MKKSIAAVLTLMTVLFCFAGCGKGYKGTSEVVGADGQTKHIATEKGGGLATDKNGDYVQVVTDDYGKEYSEPLNLTTALVYDNRIYFNDFNITLPDGWSNNEDNSSYTQANIVDESGDLITVRESTDRSAEDCLSTANLLVNGVKSKYTDSQITIDTVKVCGVDCPLRSFYIKSGAPDGTNPYTAFIVIEKDGVVLDVQIESANDLTGKLDSIIDVLSTIEFTKTPAASTTAASTAATIVTTTAATTTK